MGDNGVDYRAMRLYRSEIHRNLQEAAVEEGEDNPACTGEYDWILMPGRGVWQCDCPELAAGGPYTRETIPDYPHPNCDCMVEPRLKDAGDLIDELRAYARGEPAGNDIELWAQEHGLGEEGTVGIQIPGDIEGEPGHRGDLTQIQEDIKQLTGMESVNLAGVDKELAGGIYDGYKIVLDRYPVLRGQFSLLGNNENRSRISASTNPVTGEINVNLRFFGMSKKSFEEWYNLLVYIGFYPKGTTWKSPILHEIGHRIDGYLTKKLLDRDWNKQDFSKNISHTVRNNVLQNRGLTMDDVKENLSGYGYANAPEFFAEAFSECMSRKTPRPIAKMVGGFIDHHLKE
jgi:hypothetical protein